MSKHTPGPWLARGRYIGVKNHASFIAECRDQNGNWSNTEFSEANARLIAASPEMLAYLYKLVPEDCTGEKNCVHCEGMALIAKAEGKR